MRCFLYTDHCAPECMSLPEGCTLSEDRRIITTPDDVPEQIRVLERNDIVMRFYRNENGEAYFDPIRTICERTPRLTRENYIEINNQLEMEL